MTAVRLPKADLVIQSAVDPRDVLAASVNDYGRKLRLNAMRDMRSIAGATLKRAQVAELIQGLSDLHAIMTPEA